MNEQDIRALVADVLGGIAPEADLSVIGDSRDLRDALDLDSMDFMNFLIGLGERTGRKIPDADTSKLFTLRGVIDYLGG
jgi:acyl carrier protein